MKIVIIIISTLALVRGASWTEPVNTTQGLVRGIFAEDGDYSMYLGIPYAKVNEDNPFGASLPYPKFDGIFDAIDDSVICPQETEFFSEISGTLDCLQLNVYVPNNTTVDSTLPVLVYVHGGVFTFGNNGRDMYGPKFLVRHDIILVVINYRLGPYGFMCLDIEEVPGNQGLKDQYSALQWIKENIGAFGGDPDKVTLMGESAGAMSVDFHLMSEYPILYDQVIIQSGAGLVPNVISPSDNTIPLKLAEHLGFTTNDLHEALTVLAQTHTDLLIAATQELQMMFSPCVERKFNNEEPIIGIHPEHNNIPKVKYLNILAGYNSHEQLRISLQEEFSETLFHDNMALDFEIDEMDEMINKVRRFYIGDREINPRVVMDIVDFVSDHIFNFPVQRSVIKYLNSGAQVYQYYFSYDGGRNFIKATNNITAAGAAHADELGYLFDMNIFTEAPAPEDQLMIDRITTMWANFVKYGNPTPSTSELLPVTWPPATKEVIWYLGIDSDLSMGTRPLHARMSFWELFYSANREYLVANIHYDPNTSSSYQFLPSVIQTSLMVFTIYILQL